MIETLLAVLATTVAFSLGVAVGWRACKSELDTAQRISDIFEAEARTYHHRLCAMITERRS